MSRLQHHNFEIWLEHARDVVAACVLSVQQPFEDCFLFLILGSVSRLLRGFKVTMQIVSLNADIDS